MPCCQTHTYREKNFRNVDCVLANITLKLRTRKQTTKPQTNYRSCLWFSFLAPQWQIPHNTITLHKHFWCSLFCEFHSK